MKKRIAIFILLIITISVVGLSFIRVQDYRELNCYSISQNEQAKNSVIVLDGEKPMFPFIFGNAFIGTIIIDGIEYKDIHLSKRNRGALPDTFYGYYAQLNEGSKTIDNIFEIETDKNIQNIRITFKNNNIKVNQDVEYIRIILGPANTPEQAEIVDKHFPFLTKSNLRAY